MNAEYRLRARIRRELAEMGLDSPQDSPLAEEMENQILDLFRAYLRAPAEHRAEVYARAEQQVLERLRAARAERS